MKYFALAVLVAVLVLSLFDVGGSVITNNTVAISLMVLLLALFSDLKEFNFWGLQGKKKEEKLKKLIGSQILVEDSISKPSKYKLNKALKEDRPDQMENLKDNYLAMTYEIERIMRIIVRSIRRSTEKTALLDPESVLNYLEDEEFLTPEACDSIEQLRAVRRSITHAGANVPTETLEASVRLASPIYAELKAWLDEASKR